MQRSLIPLVLLCLALPVSAAQQVINIGTAPNDGTGDNLRTLGTKLNTNFDYLFTAITNVSGAVTVGQTLFVDVANGDDDTATRGRMDLPYATIEAAVTASQEGDTIVVRPGTYDVTPATYTSDVGTITPQLYLKDKRNLTMLGYGAILSTANYGHMLTIEGSTNIVVEGFEFRQGTIGMTRPGPIAAVINHRNTNSHTTFRNLRFVGVPNQCISHCYPPRASDNWTVVGCYAENFGQPAATSPTTVPDGSLVSGAPFNSIIANNRTAGTNWGILLEIDGQWTTNRTSGKTIIADNLLQGAHQSALVIIEQTTSSGGTPLNNVVGNVLVTGNTFEHGPHNTSGNLVVASSGRDLTFANNQFISTHAKTGVVLLKTWKNAGTQNAVTNVIVSANQFVGGMYGLFSDDGTTGASITGNTFRDQDTASIFAWFDGAAITGNTFLGANRLTASGGGMIQLFRNDAEPCDNISISGNVFHDVAATPTTWAHINFGGMGYAATNIIVGPNVHGAIKEGREPINIMISDPENPPDGLKEVGTRPRFKTGHGIDIEDGTSGWPGVRFGTAGFYGSGSGTNKVVSFAVGGGNVGVFRREGYGIGPDKVFGWLKSNYAFWDTYLQWLDPYLVLQMPNSEGEIGIRHNWSRFGYEQLGSQIIGWRNPGNTASDTWLSRYGAGIMQISGPTEVGIRYNQSDTIAHAGAGGTVWADSEGRLRYSNTNGQYVVSLGDTSTYATVESVETVSDAIAALDLATPKLGETNTTDIGFSSLHFDGPTSRKQRFSTGATLEINWDSDLDVFHFVNEPVTVSQTGTPKLGQTVSIVGWNSNAANYEITFDGLPWVFQRTVNTVRSNSWIEAFATYTTTNSVDYYRADASAPAATTTVGEGGSGRTTHPQNYLLVGDGPNSFKAAAIGPGLGHSGSGQAMSIFAEDAIATPALLEITTVLGGAPVWTNDTALVIDQSTFLTADVMFSGETNSVLFETQAVFRYADLDNDTLTVSTNQLKAPSGSSLWAGWTTNAAYKPVLQFGGLGNEDGVIQIANIRRRGIALTALSIPEADPWAGYVWTESFEGTGSENEVSESSGTLNFDATDYASHGSQASKYNNEASAASSTFLLPSNYDRVSGRFSIRVSASPNAETRVLVLRDSAGTQVMAISVTTSRTLKVYAGGTSFWCDNGFGSGEWVTIYYEYAKGTGANSIARAGWSNDGTKTATSGNIAQKTNGTDTAQVSQLSVRSDSRNWILWHDAIVVHPTFTWADLPAGLPSGM